MINNRATEHAISLGIINDVQNKKTQLFFPCVIASSVFVPVRFPARPRVRSDSTALTSDVINKY
jgi:hypothetical protein